MNVPFGGSQYQPARLLRRDGCVWTYAAMLGFQEQARLRRQTSDEEGELDKKLSGLAESVE